MAILCRVAPYALIDRKIECRTNTRQWHRHVILTGASIRREA
jgi:hypothetical protein